MKERVSNVYGMRTGGRYQQNPSAITNRQTRSTLRVGCSYKITSRSRSGTYHLESPCNQHRGHPQASEEEQDALPVSRRNILSLSVIDNIRRLYNSGAKPEVIHRYILGYPATTAC